MGNSPARRKGYSCSSIRLANSYLLIFSIIVNSYYRGIEYYSTTGQNLPKLQLIAPRVYTFLLLGTILADYVNIIIIEKMLLIIVSHDAT